MIHVLRERRLAVLMDALRLWVVVLVANFLGTMIFAVGLYFADIFEPAQTAALQSVSGHILGGEFRDTFFPQSLLAG